MEHIPTYSDDLIKVLDETFGHFLPKPITPEQETWYRLGQRSVIDAIKAIKSREEAE